MKIASGRNFSIELKNQTGAGTVWVVRVHRKGFPFKRLVSSDWFLDESQARNFAEKIATTLRDGNSIASLQNRKPGWVLFQSSKNT